MVHFSLFGFPICVQPSFWIVLALFGGVLEINTLADFFYVALFVIAGFIAILAHELGHAFVGRRLGGGEHAITLALCGGITQSYNMHLNKTGRILTILAGPAATFGIGLIAFYITYTLIGPALVAHHYSWVNLVCNPWLAANFDSRLYILSCLILIGEWWTIFNLLPIIPMDGGQLLAECIRSQRTVFLIGIFTSLCIAVLWFIFLAGFFIPIIMLFFAYSNYRAYQHSNY